MASLYLNDDLHADAFVVGARVPIWGAEARHAAQVARVRTGERVGIGDGRGRIAWGPVVHVAQAEVAISAETITIADVPRPSLVLVQALAKGDRDELAVQAATELGVAEVVPWQAARSVSVWKGDKVAKGLERWRAIVREASKQAIRAAVPHVAALVSTRELAASIAASGPGTTALVLEPTGSEPLTAVGLADSERVLLIVGPEGGIDPEELRTLELAGARIVRLGSEVLRTSTAGPAAIAALKVRLGRW